MIIKNHCPFSSRLVQLFVSVPVPRPDPWSTEVNYTRHIFSLEPSRRGLILRLPSLTLRAPFLLFLLIICVIHKIGKVKTFQHNFNKTLWVGDTSTLITKRVKLSIFFPDKITRNDWWLHNIIRAPGEMSVSQISNITDRSNVKKYTWFISSNKYVWMFTFSIRITIATC